LCPDSSLKLTATTGAPNFAVGQQPIIGVSVANRGTVACTRDLSGTLQVFSVYTSGGARVWSTADCSPGSGTDVRTLQPGEAVQYNIKWSGTTSNPGCTADRIQVPAGHYQLRADIGSLHATPVSLTIG
jgi:hypothetical protein